MAEKPETASISQRYVVSMANQDGHGAGFVTTDDIEAWAKKMEAKGWEVSYAVADEYYANLERLASLPKGKVALEREAAKNAASQTPAKS